MSQTYSFSVCFCTFWVLLKKSLNWCHKDSLISFIKFLGLIFKFRFFKSIWILFLCVAEYMNWFFFQRKLTPFTEWSIFSPVIYNVTPVVYQLFMALFYGFLFDYIGLYVFVCPCTITTLSWLLEFNSTNCKVSSSCFAFLHKCSQLFLALWSSIWILESIYKIPQQFLWDFC